MEPGAVAVCQDDRHGPAQHDLPDMRVWLGLFTIMLLIPTSIPRCLLAWIVFAGVALTFGVLLAIVDLWEQAGK